MDLRAEGVRSGALLARGAGRLAGHDRRVDVVQDDVLGDHDGRDVLAAGDVVHHRLEHLLHDRPEPAGAGAAEDRLVRDRLERVVGELQFHAVELEQPPVLAHQGVLRLGEDVDQRLAVQLLHAGDHRQPADELGDHAELQQVLGHDLGEGVGLLDLGLAAHLGAEADALLADPLLDDLVQAGERATHDEQHVGGVDLDELLVRVLAATLRRHGRRRPLEDLQQRLLHALAGDVPGDRRVLALAGDLVDLVDVDDPGLGALDVVVGRLDQLQQDVLDVLTDVAGLGQGGGVGDRERHVEHPGEGLRQVGLAAPGRAHQQDVGLGQLHAVVAAAPLTTGLDPLVVVVDRHGERALGLVLADDVLLEEVVDLLGLRQLVELEVRRLRELLLDDLVAEVDALIADVHTGASDQLLDLLLALAAERALQQVATLTDTRHLADLHLEWDGAAAAPGTCFSLPLSTPAQLASVVPAVLTGESGVRRTYPAPPTFWRSDAPGVARPVTPASQLPRDPVGPGGDAANGTGREGDTRTLGPPRQRIRRGVR